jgi:hypothetical protein
MTGAIVLSSDDAGIVIRGVISLLALSGGEIQLKNGIYNVKTLVNATRSVEGTNWAAIVIPGNLGTGLHGVFKIIGESRPYWVGMFSPTLPLAWNGTIINILQTAVNTAPASARIFGIYSAYDDIYGNYVEVKELGIRFPTNQRGGVNGIDVSFAQNSEIVDINVDFAIDYANLLLPVWSPFSWVGSAGITTTKSTKTSNYLAYCIVTGFGTGFNLGSEHTLLEDCSAYRCEYAGFVGALGGSVYHASTLINFQDLECIRGLFFGSTLKEGTVWNIISYCQEITEAGIWARIAYATEERPGIIHGEVSYTTVVGGSPPNQYRAFWEAGSGVNTTVTTAFYSSTTHGIAYTMGYNTVTFITGLPAFANLVLCSFNSTAYGSYAWSTPAWNQVTITVTNAGDYTVYWYASCTSTFP